MNVNDTGVVIGEALATAYAVAFISLWLVLAIVGPLALIKYCFLYLWG